VSPKAISESIIDLNRNFLDGYVSNLSNLVADFLELSELSLVSRDFALKFRQHSGPLGVACSGPKCRFKKLTATLLNLDLRATCNFIGNP
jgi:hypothetical protein